MHFSFVLLLALNTIVNLHVKLRRAEMVVEDHEETSDGGHGLLQNEASRP
jgi:hypothetical protein